MRSLLRLSLGALALLVFAAACSPAEAQLFRRRQSCASGQCGAPAAYATPQVVYTRAYATPQAPAPPPAEMTPASPHVRQTSSVAEASPAQQPAQAPIASSDPYGFMVWLNEVRGQWGLPGVWYDEGLTAAAAANSARGFGHTIREGRRQNVGAGAAAQVWPMWISSPAHRVALLDPSITRAGIAYVNGVWTFNGD